MSDQENIILTGFMGTGKTTVGRKLAERLGWRFVDTDDLVVEREGRDITEIFRTDGEIGFREWEERITRELASERGLVIATGGRLMLDPANAVALGSTGPVFCLSAGPDQISERLSFDPERRPLLEAPDPAVRVRSLLQQRAAGYARFLRVATDGRTPEEVTDEIIRLLDDNLRQKLTVTHPTGSYDIFVGRGLLSELAERADVAGMLAVVTDDHVGPRYAHLVRAAQTVITVPAGEAYKNLDTVRDIYDQLLAAGIDRQGAVVGLGGGVIGDMAGFAAASYLRGIGMILAPTTLLSMVDSSIGGKTGVDLPQGKNLVGAFKQPRLVVADTAVLATLPAVEFAAGLAEIAKHGLIADPVLWQRLMIEEWTHAPAAYATDRLLGSSLQTLITQAIAVKQQVVQEDPFEQGRRAVLNLGHTFGHAIEQVSGYEVRHGFGVAMGLVAAAHLSAALGHCSPSLPKVVEMVLARLGLPTHIPLELDPEALYEAMGSDKKKQQGRLRFILLRDIGDVFVTDDVPETAVMEILTTMRA
ncbi:MAG: 3-dehydroquinate synthase [Chloroflexota bacterium]